MKMMETPAPRTFEEIFHSRYKLKSDMQIIDNLCVKFKLEPIQFWNFYNNHIKDFSGDGFIQNMLEYFYFYCETEINKLTKPEGLDIFGWFYFENEVIILSTDGEIEFENLTHLPYNIRKKFMENDIFKHFITEVKKDIFSTSEKRRMKLEKLQS